MGEAEVAADGVHHRVDRGVHQPSVAELADVELDMGSLDPGQGVEPVVLAPGEPLPQLEGVQGVGAPGVPGQVGHRGQLGRRHRRGLERKKRRGSGHGVTSRGDRLPDQTRSPPTRPGTWTASTLDPFPEPRPHEAERATSFIKQMTPGCATWRTAGSRQCGLRGFANLPRRRASTSACSAAGPSGVLRRTCLRRSP